MKYLIEYETPEMTVLMFEETDIATNLQASGAGTGANPNENENLDFGGGFN